MSLARTPRRLSVDEYLLVERASELRSEYVDGQMFSRSGSSRAHNLIAGNATAVLHNGLRQGRCEVYQSAMRVQVANTGLFAYPDVLVACPPIDWIDDRTDMLGNPVLIIEVLSPSTAAFDRGEKFLRYQRLPSLHHYLLVAQDQCKVEHFRRQGKAWLIEVHDKLDDAVKLDALGLSLGLLELYERVWPAG